MKYCKQKVFLRLHDIFSLTFWFSHYIMNDMVRQTRDNSWSSLHNFPVYPFFLQPWCFGKDGMRQYSCSQRCSNFPAIPPALPRESCAIRLLLFTKSPKEACLLSKPVHSFSAVSTWDIIHFNELAVPPKVQTSINWIFCFDHIQKKNHVHHPYNNITRICCQSIEYIGQIQNFLKKNNQKY
jgi:hypothetical protein